MDDIANGMQDREVEFFTDLAAGEFAAAESALRAWVNALFAEYPRLRRVKLGGRLTAEERGVHYAATFWVSDPRTGEALVDVADLADDDVQADALYAIQDGFGSSDEARRFGLAIPADDDVTFDRRVA